MIGYTDRYSAFPHIAQSHISTLAIEPFNNLTIQLTLYSYLKTKT